MNALLLVIYDLKYHWPSVGLSEPDIHSGCAVVGTSVGSAVTRPAWDESMSQAISETWNISSIC